MKTEQTTFKINLFYPKLKSMSVVVFMISLCTCIAKLPENFVERGPYFHSPEPPYFYNS